MLNSNYYIINRKARRFSELRIAGSTLIFLDDNGRPADYGVLPVSGSVYAALYCDEARNVTFVTDRNGVHDVFTILWCSDSGYRSGLEALRSVIKMHFSKQNIRLNRYAESIAEKLDIGVRIRVADAVDESKMTVCPECGMLNPVGSPYCLDCGAEL